MASPLRPGPWYRGRCDPRFACTTGRVRRQRPISTWRTDGADRTDTDLIEVILNDHRAFEAVFKELEEGAAGAETRKSLVDHVIAELVRH